MCSKSFTCDIALNRRTLEVRRALNDVCWWRLDVDDVVERLNLMFSDGRLFERSADGVSCLFFDGQRVEVWL